MKAIQVQTPGGAEALKLVDIPVPKPKPQEALVKISFSGVNFIDVYFREGRYKAPLPLIDGQEAAGVVTEVGSEVKSLHVGDRVAYAGVLGSYAEYASVPATRLIRIPEGVTDEQAAAGMLQGMTAHYLVHSTYVLKKGETALVHAAAGGTGLMIVQVAKLAGARVIGTVGSEEKARLAREAGADEVINYRTTEFDKEVKRLTDGKGIDVVYDGVGKDTFDKDFNVLRVRGYLVLFGASSGAVAPFDPIKLAQGSFYLTRPGLPLYIGSREELEWRATDVLRMIADGKLKIRIGRTYALEEVADAHRDLEGRRTMGKLTVKI